MWPFANNKAGKALSCPIVAIRSIATLPKSRPVWQIVTPWQPHCRRTAVPIGANHAPFIKTKRAVASPRRHSKGSNKMFRIVPSLVAAFMLVAAPAVAGQDQPLTGKAATDEKPITTAKVEEKAEPEMAAAPAGPVAPVNGRIIHQSEGGQMCIGGVLCSEFCSADSHDCKPTPSLTIKLDKPARINTIQLSAHDNIGKTRRSRLVVKVNGKPVADTLVYKLGSTLSIDVGETGELITIESAHQYNGFLRGGEEAVIWDVYVFGEDQG
jgi:hypothetical protein